MSKIILDLCGGTGAWSKPYEKAGYDVRLITLPNYNVIRTIFSDELIFFQDSDGKRSPYDYIEKGKVYGILASPVCTMFSLARTRAKTPRDLRQGMELVIPCLNIIWECRYDHKLAFWCLENPMGILRQFLGRPAFTFDPCDFGDPYTKKTDLWGYFNITKKNPIKLSENQRRETRTNGRRLPSISEITSSKQAAKRAITSLGFARAFFEANK